MRFKIRFASQIVGLFVIIAAVSLSALIVLMGANQRWFSKNYHFLSRFGSGKGISVGMPISFRGFEIGRVSGLRLAEDNTVEVGFYIQDTYYPKVYEHSVLQLTTSPIGLGGGMVFHQGRSPTSPLPEESFIPSLDSAEGRALVSAGLVVTSQEVDAVSDVLSGVGPVLANLNRTLVNVDLLVSTVNLAVQGKAAGELGAIVKDTRRIVANVESTTAAVSGSIEESLARSNQLLADLTVITENLKATSEALKDPRGAVKTLIDPKGSIATLLDDDDVLFRRIDSILRNINDSILELRDFAAFVNTTRPQVLGVLEEGKSAIAVGKDVLEGLKNNPLLRGGIPERVKAPTTLRGFRDRDF